MTPSSRMPVPPEPKTFITIGWMGWILAGLLAAGLTLCYWKTSHAETVFTTPYQAVLLSSGAVYYGKLQGY